jgi:hypothetical protein
MCTIFDLPISRGDKMRTTILILASLAITASAAAQTEVWIKVEEGSVLHLNPNRMEWIPVSSRQRLPAKSFVIMKPGAAASLFKETDVYQLPDDAYFYVEDLFQRDRVQIVAALTQIEAEQLPVNTTEPGEKRPKVIGLTYGVSETGQLQPEAIPLETERLKAVEWFYGQKRYDASLLTLKRMMTKFPSLYMREFYVERLLTLYDHLRLYGFLLDESNRLTGIRQSESFTRIVTDWHKRAKEKLVTEKPD